MFGRLLSFGARSAVVATVVLPPLIIFPSWGVKTTAKNMMAKMMRVEMMNDFDMHRTTISRLATIPTVLQKLGRAGVWVFTGPSPCRSRAGCG